MSGNSNVGQASVYEAGDQRNVKASEVETADRFEEGKSNSHQANDSSKNTILSSKGAAADRFIEDQRSIANRLAAEEVCLMSLTHSRDFINT